MFLMMDRNQLNKDIVLTRSLYV